MEMQRAKILALACAAAVSFGAYAQQSASDQAGGTSATPTSTSPTSSTPSATSPTPTNPTTTPTTPPPGTSPTTSGLTPPPGTAGSTAMGSSNNQVFASLDRTHKGYLTQSDVASNKYLSANFQRCDTNSDSRLSQIEVSTCMQGASSSQR